MKKIVKKENLLIVCMLAIVSTFVFFSVMKPKEITISNSANILSLFRNPFVKNTKNILVLGMTGSGNNGSLLTDAILFVNLDLVKKKINLISIPRDLLVQIPNSSRYSKINGLLAEDNLKRKTKNGAVQSFNIEKWDLIKTEVEEITALKVDNVAVVDLDGFRYFIDSLGGINVYLEQPLVDPNLSNPDAPGESFRLEAGWNYLDGKKAAKFVRSRFGPTGDFYRIGHQHDLLAAIFQKLKSLKSLSNIKQLLDIWNSWKGYLFTDISINEGINLAKIGNDLNMDDIRFVTISYSKPDQLLINPGQSSFGYVLTPQEGVDNYTAIREYINQKINE